MISIDEQIEILQAYKEGKTIIGYVYIPGPCNPPEEGDFSFNIKTHPDAAFNFQEKYYSIKPEQETHRMTNRELARWLSEGKGEWAYNSPSNKQAATWFKYFTDDALDPCNADIVIRAWDEEEWHEPLVEVRDESAIEN